VLLERGPLSNFAKSFFCCVGNKCNCNTIEVCLKELFEAISVGTEECPHCKFIVTYTAIMF
jgi:hypothetical protein